MTQHSRGIITPGRSPVPRSMIGCAVFGAGVIGEVHARNVSRHGSFDLRYVIDPAIDRARTLAQTWGGTAAADIAPALADDTVAAVIIASSTSAHEEHALACAGAGKAFICEKPLAGSLEGARACVASAAASGVVAATGFNRRLDHDYAAVAARTLDGEIGAVEMLHFASRGHKPPAPETAPHSGGMIREKGAHFFDLAAWLTGAEPVEVYAVGACLVDPRFADYGDVDTAALTVRFDSGALATFDFGRRAVFGQDELIEVFGSQGMLVTGRHRRGNVAHFTGGAVTEAEVMPGWHERFADSYVAELDVFAAAMTHGEPVHASLADGLRAQAVAEAAVRSIKQNRPVAIERIW